jgi:octaprenyl-diphosphate synthase
MSTLPDILKPAGRGLQRVEKIILECLLSPTEAVHELERYEMLIKGKRIRPAMAILSGAVAGKLTEKNYYLAASLELIHIATLVHDDVIDGAEVRRGRATYNAAWGNPVAVLFGDYLLSRAFAILSRFGEDGTLPAVTQTTREVCEGEIYHMRRRFDIGMNEEHYRTMISLKTASLFSACCSVSALLAGAPAGARESLGRFGMWFGMAYQVIDDCLDITGGGTSKDRLKDLERGRVTLPLIKALGMLGGKNRERLALAFREANVERCLEEILSTNAITECIRDAAGFMGAARDELFTLTDNEFRHALFRLTDYVIEQAKGVTS